MIKKIWHILYRLRFFNALMILSAQYALFLLDNETTSGVSEILASTLLVVLSANFLNEYLDQNCDKINAKPNLFSVFEIPRSLVVLIVLSAFLLAIYTVKNNPRYVAIVLIVELLLLSYELYFKSTPLLGNVIIGICSVLSISFFKYNFELHYMLMFYVSAQLFLLQIQRELVKDIRDMKGDFALGFKTFPIVLGIKRSQTIIQFLSLITIASSFLFVFIYKTEYWLLTSYVVLFNIVPMSILTFKIAEGSKDFKSLDLWLKLELLSGIIFIYLYYYVGK